MQTICIATVVAMFASVSAMKLSSSRIRHSCRLFGSFQGYSQPSTKQGAYVQAKDSGSMPCIILVNPFLDQNVGSVARAMLNFGHYELRVVQPRCDIRSESARALAAGAEEVLDQAKVFESLSDCIADLSLVLATSDRTRGFTQLVLTPQQAASKATATIRSSPEHKVGIVFGRERFGLCNEELALADALVVIPTSSHFSSLNLAQAVNIICYETRLQFLIGNEKDYNSLPPTEWLHTKDHSPLATKDDLEHLFGRLFTALDARQYCHGTEQRRSKIYNAIRNVFQRTLMSRAEVQTLHGVLSSLTGSPLSKEQATTSTEQFIESSRTPSNPSNDAKH